MQQLDPDFKKSRQILKIWMSTCQIKIGFIYLLPLMFQRSEEILRIKKKNVWALSKLSCVKILFMSQNSWIHIFSLVLILYPIPLLKQPSHVSDAIILCIPPGWKPVTFHMAGECDNLYSVETQTPACIKKKKKNQRRLRIGFIT